MLKVSLVIPNLRYGSNMLWSVLPSRGLLSLGAVLKTGGYPVQFIDADLYNLSNANIVKKIAIFGGDKNTVHVICITMNSFQAHSGIELAKDIRNWSNITGIRTVIIVGGPHPSAVGKKILEENRCIDIVCKGESEVTIIELMKAIETTNNFAPIKGISYRHYDDVFSNPDRQRIENIDSIPFPAFDLAGDIRRYPGAAPVLRPPTMHIMASRGCPYRCTFCSSRNVWGNTVRFRSPKNIVDEVEMLNTHYGINEVFFQDDTMNVDGDWFYNVCNEIIRRKQEGRIKKDMAFKAPFRVNSRLLDESLLAKAKEAGFWIIFYGVESGNQRVLDTIKKGTTIEEIKRAFKMTHEAGIAIIAAFMVGNVGDTAETVNESILLAKEICRKGDVCGFSIATPLPGTEFYTIAKEKGWIHTEDYRNYSTFGAVTRNEALTAGEISALANRANSEVYKHLNR